VTTWEHFSENKWPNCPEICWYGTMEENLTFVGRDQTTCSSIHDLPPLPTKLQPNFHWPVQFWLQPQVLWKHWNNSCEPVLIIQHQHSSSPNAEWKKVPAAGVKSLLKFITKGQSSNKLMLTVHKNEIFSNHTRMQCLDAHTAFVKRVCWQKQQCDSMKKEVKEERWKDWDG